MKKIVLINQKLAKLIILSLFLSLTLNAQSKKPAAPKQPGLKSEDAKKAPPKMDGSIVELTTDYGVIKIKLYDATPKHQTNFLKLAKSGFYDSLLFHRVIQGFMIQGGDPTSKNAPVEKMLGGGDIGVKIPAEFNDAFYHKRGAVAAARDNNPEMQSSGCQFYIVQGKKISNEELNAMEQRSGKPYTAEQRKTYTDIGGTPFLDHAYTVFGEVISGMDAVDAIAALPKGAADRPINDVIIKSIKILK